MLKVTGDTGTKRKSSTPSTEDGRAEKRVRKEAEDKDTAIAVDGTRSKVSPVLLMTTVGTSKPAVKDVKPSELQISSTELVAKKPKTKRIVPPNGDSLNPVSVRQLHAHKSEVC